MSKLDVGVIFGGKSSEHEVSLQSAAAIIRNISKEKYNVHMIGITKSGKWILFSGDVDDLPSGKWENDINNKYAVISPDVDVHGLLIKDGEKFSTLKLDVIIPALHGKNGEDGTIQGLFELAGIPYVGCRCASSAACMDKIMTNAMLSYFGVKKAKFHWFTKFDFEKNQDFCVSETERVIKNYPMFVKPANAGSSVGITKALNRQELIEAFKKALVEDDRILVEESVKGREVECAVLGNDELTASVVGEIAPSNDFYDYNAKYLSGTSELFIPARISEEKSAEIQNIAKQAYRIMDCKGLARVDFFVKESTEEVYLNEINTFPGFTSISMYPKLMERIGIKFDSLVDELIKLALEMYNS